MIDEPERFLKYYEQQLSKDEMRKIVDFESFLKATKETFNRDNSLPNLWDDVNGKTKGLMEIFNTRKVQDLIIKNSRTFIIDYIMKKKNIERGRAESVFSKLSPRKQSKLIKKFTKGSKIRISQQKTKSQINNMKMIQQTRGGKTYYRTKPTRWTQMQERFIKNNKQKGVRWVTEYYNRIFIDNKRTKSSIQNKYYRVD